VNLPILGALAALKRFGPGRKNCLIATSGRRNPVRGRLNLARPVALGCPNVLTFRSAAKNGAERCWLILTIGSHMTAGGWYLRLSFLGSQLEMPIGLQQIQRIPESVRHVPYRRDVVRSATTEEGDTK
jgi:hypothetical protein